MKNDKLHKEAKRLLKLEATAEKRSSDYNSRRKEATAALKPVLTSIWEAFDRGETVGGCKGPKEWCKTVGTITYARCRQIITGKSGNGGKGSSHLTQIKVGLAGTDINVKAGFADQYIEIEQRREIPYHGEQRDSRDYSHEQCPNMIGNWIHPVYDVQGRITVRFEQRGATDKDLAAGLFKKLKVTLKALRLWDDVLTQEFNHQVAETIHCEGEYKERRSERAKRAAETRKRNTPGSKTVNTAPVLVPEQFHEDGAFPGPPIKIKLTKAQMREMHRLHKGLEPHQDAYDFGNDEVGFKSSFYQEHAKKLVMGLQKQIDRYVNEYNSQFDEWTRDDLLNWTNKSPESMRAKEEAARIHGAIRACEGAISEITYGDLNSDDLARNIRGWWEKRRDAELGISDQHQEEVEHESESTIHACQDQQQ